MKREAKLAVMLVLLGFSLFVNVRLFVPSVRAWTPFPSPIIQDTTLTLVNSPYRVINDVTVYPGVKLTIEPGVEVQFADSFSLIVEGSFNASGTSLNPIVFTSSRVANDPPDPYPGAWNTIKFKGNSSEQFLLKHAKVKYAVHGVTVESLGSATIEKSEIANCSVSGVYIMGESILLIRDSILTSLKYGVLIEGTSISGITIQDNVVDTFAIDGSSGIYIDATAIDLAVVSYITIQNNQISSNENGILINAVVDASSGHAMVADIIVRNNRVTANENGMYISPYVFHYDARDLMVARAEDIIIENNEVTSSKNGIYIYSFTDYEYQPYAKAYGRAYTFNITIRNNQVISNENGVHIYAFGWDIAYAYDITVQDNTVTSARNGMYIKAVGYLAVQYGIPSGAWVYNITIRNNKAFNTSTGLRIDVSGYRQTFTYDIAVTYNIFSANNEGMRIIHVKMNASQNSVFYNSFGVIFSGTTGNLALLNDIYGNSMYGMYIEDGAKVNASHNYWGDPSGPYHPSINPEGKGNPVNGDGTDLDFWPSLTSPVGTINERPIAVLTVDKDTVAVNDAVTFDASGSTDDGRIDYYFFDFGDGTNSGWTTLSVVKHKYASEATYNANLIVMDDFGVKSNNTATKTITVSGELPSLTVSLTLNPTTIESNGDVSVSIHITDGITAIEDASVQLLSDKGGSFTQSSGYTDSNGDFSTTFTAPNVDEKTDLRVTATASKSGYTDGSDYKYVTVYPPGTLFLSVTVTANPNTLQSGGTSTITVQVTDGTNSVPDTTVTLSSNNGGSLSPTSGTTDGNGYFTSTYTAPSVTAETTVTITATASKTGYVDGQGQTEITVSPSEPSPPPDQTLWIYLPVLVVVLSIIGAGIAIAKRKRHELKEERAPNWKLAPYENNGKKGDAEHYAFGKREI